MQTYFQALVTNDNTFPATNEIHLRINYYEYTVGSTKSRNGKWGNEKLERNWKWSLTVLAHTVIIQPVGKLRYHSLEKIYNLHLVSYTILTMWTHDFCVFYWGSYHYNKWRSDSDFGDNSNAARPNSTHSMLMLLTSLLKFSDQEDSHCVDPLSSRSVY